MSSNVQPTFDPLHLLVNLALAQDVPESAFPSENSSYWMSGPVQDTKVQDFGTQSMASSMSISSLVDMIGDSQSDYLQNQCAFGSRASMSDLSLEKDFQHTASARQFTPLLTPSSSPFFLNESFHPGVGSSSHDGVAIVHQSPLLPTKCQVSEQKPSKRKRTTSPTGQNHQSKSLQYTYHANGVKAEKYTCNLCAKGFKRKHHIESHLVTHQVEYNFRCHLPGCTSKFRRNQDLLRHWRNVKH
ncbi:hypothetical protein BDR26DRAFT_866941 [Obelidium mucronatum]|nr:hypothetical protein BDR26DRAFT_866941 [Obelidium mucronatum]